MKRPGIKVLGHFPNRIFNLLRKATIYLGLNPRALKNVNWGHRSQPHL